MKTFRALPSFNGVGASQTATLDLPIGRTYHGILITFGGTTMTLALMTEMRLILNGRTIQTITGAADLDIINRFNGRAPADGQIYWDFERFGLDNVRMREATVIGTGMPQNLDRESPNYEPVEVATLKMEIDIGAATAPTLSAKALTSAKRPLGWIHHRRKFIHSPSASGDFEVSDLPKGMRLDKLYIKTADGDVNSVVLDRDNFRLFDRTVAENNQQQIDGVRVPMPLWYVLDPSETGDGDQTIVTDVSDFRLIMDMAGADTLTMYADYVGPFSG